MNKDTPAFLPAFEPHFQRDAVHGELHARPFRLIETPRIFLRYGFATNGAGAEKDREWFAGFCQAKGIAGPGAGARHHLVALGKGQLRWEQHGEFTTYTWDGPAAGGGAFSTPPEGHPFGAGFRQPGPLLVAVRLDLLKLGPADMEEGLKPFDRTSLAVSEVENGAAIIATDFREDKDGLTRYLIEDASLNPQQAGAVAQRLLEVETYRVLCMLGLPEANRHAPAVARIEEGLLDIATKMRDSEGFDLNRRLLDDLTRLAAELEAGAAASAYRFGASRAYSAIIEQRLEAIDEKPLPGYFTLGQFLTRRLAPAMRTCRTIEERQANLSRKLSRAANLLRTRVEVELQKQNSDLLSAMNRRVRLQLRLQQTVEGLSVAAVSYYVVGLVGYLAKGASEAGLPMISPSLLTAFAVPVVIVAIWLTVRRIRAHHTDRDEEA